MLTKHQLYLFYVRYKLLNFLKVAHFIPKVPEFLSQLGEAETQLGEAAIQEFSITQEDLAELFLIHKDLLLNLQS